MRILAVPFALFLVSPLLAGEPKAHRDLPYAEPKNERQMLDVYAPTTGKNLPVVVWIHGGGWRKGDKADVHNKPKAFTDKGFILVSVNYRFVTNVTIKQMAGDVAKAIRWTHDHARDYSGDPNTIIVMGHSAGAQLAALVCTDDRYLKAEGLPLSIIKGCVPVDGGTYDVPMQVKAVDAKRADSLRTTFGGAESQKELSAVTHVARGKNIPPFLLLHIAANPETKAQAERLARVLNEAGISARSYSAEEKTHTTINADLGLADDKPTHEVWAVLSASLSRADPYLSEQMDTLKKLGARITLDDQKRVIGVNLGERKVTDADLVHLRGLQHLQELDLTRTRITGAGLANVKDLTTLRKLFLTDTKVDDSGVTHLNGMKRLELVGLSGTRITDAALDHLRGLTGLKSLFCIGTGVTDTGVEKLQRALPQCQVTH
jgi:acetyl esterase/lipase